jgi:hypothetical protein
VRVKSIASIFEEESNPRTNQRVLKVEKILKGSLDLIPPPSPSGKVHIMGGKICLRFKGKTLP